MITTWVLHIALHCYGIGCVSVENIPFKTLEECSKAAATIKLVPSPKATSIAYCRPVVSAGAPRNE